MSKNTLQLKIVTPEREVYSNADVTEVTIPTGGGEITVLPNHIPLVTTIKHGEMRATLADGTVKPFSVTTGVVEIQPSSKVVILADHSDHAEEIDLEEAEKAYERAKEAMEGEVDPVSVEYLRLEALMKKELNRLEIARKWCL